LIYIVQMKSDKINSSRQLSEYEIVGVANENLLKINDLKFFYFRLFDYISTIIYKSQIKKMSTAGLLQLKEEANHLFKNILKNGIKIIRLKK